MRYQRGLGWLFLVMFALQGCASGSGLRPALEEFSSEWIDIVAGGMMGEPGSGVPEVRLMLHNKTAKTVWVRSRFEVPAPNAGCDVVRVIEPDATVAYGCVQQQIVAGVDYPIQIEVFSNAALATPVEQRVTHMGFVRRDIEAFMALLTPVTLPARFDHIVHVEKFGLKTAFFGDLLNKSGTVTIDEERIEYVAGDVSIIVPLSDVIRVYRKQIKAPPNPAWVVVEYEQNGQTKLLGFSVSAFKSYQELPTLFRTLLFAKNRQLS